MYVLAEFTVLYGPNKGKRSRTVVTDWEFDRMLEDERLNAKAIERW